MGNKWAVLIGINTYHESLGPLRYCKNDVELMQKTLMSECCGFPSENVLMLTDDQPEDRRPTFGNIHSWLGTWLSRQETGDLVIFYFAGHGREVDGKALLAPIDATLDSLSVTGIPLDYLRDLFDRCAARRKVLILDACHSGAGRDVAAMTAGMRESLDEGEGIYTIASCDAEQVSYEWPDKENGVFTYYVVDAIQHSAPMRADGRVSLDSVFETARKSILAWTAGKRVKQEPVRVCRTKGDISIASRPLSLQQQVDVLAAQVRAQEGTIESLEEELKSLASEKDELLSRVNEAAANRAAMERGRTNRIKLREWRDWVGKKGPYDGDFQILAFILVGIIGGLVWGFLTGKLLFSSVLGVSAATAGLAGVVGGLIFGPGIGFTLWLMKLRAWQNKYRMYCLDECVKGGDLIGAASYACAMGRIGIDLGTGAASVCSVADLQLASGRWEQAEMLYERASGTWKSPHARQALEEIRKARLNKSMS